jgi:hypothetical protein
MTDLWLLWFIGWLRMTKGYFYSLKKRWHFILDRLGIILYTLPDVCCRFFASLYVETI